MSGIQKQAGSLILGKILALIVTFILPMFLSRYLSKGEYGLYSQLFSVVLFLSSFFCLGMESSLYYYYPTASKNERRIYVFQSFVVLIFLSFIAALLLIIPFLRHLLIGDGELNNNVFTIIIIVMLMIPSIILVPLYVLKKDYKLSVFFPTSEVALRVTIIIIFVLLFKQGVTSVFNAFVVSTILVFVFVLFYVVKEIGLKPHFFRIDVRLLKKQISYSLPFGLSNSIKTFSGMVDKIIAISYLTTSEYATYIIAFYGIPGIMQIYDSLSQVAVIRMTEYFNMGENKEAHKLYKKLVIHIYSITIPAILIVTFYADKIITLLFTNKFLGSTPLFQAYLFTFLTIFGGGLILRSTDKTKYTFKAYLYSASFSVPLTIILVKYFGMKGALVGAILSTIIPRLIMMYMEMKLIQSKLSDYLPWREMGTILIVSISVLCPFALLEYYFPKGIIMSGSIAILYLSIVALLEIKLELFLVDITQIRAILRKVKFSFVQIFSN